MGGEGIKEEREVGREGEGRVGRREGGGGEEKGGEEKGRERGKNDNSGKMLSPF